MRLAALLVLVPSLAHADDIGIYFDEAVGGASYRGELADYGTGAPRLQLSFSARRGPWTVSLFGGGADPDALTIDCYGDECDGPEPASYAFGGVDLKRAWPLFRPRWHHTGVRLFMHGGPRFYAGGGAINGYSGPGIGGGAGIEGDFFVIGYYVDFGIDAFRLSSEMDTLHGSTPYVMVGGRLGWM